MKSISIAFNADSLTIPICYHHQVQGLIYSLLRQGSGEALHDDSLDFGLRQYKLFTFSSLRGGKIISKQKSLYFMRSAYLDVRSVRPEFCDALIAGLNSGHELSLYGQGITISSFSTQTTTLSENRLRLKMLSPLTIHRTDEDGHTCYLTPLDSDFADEISKNFIRKYYAFTGQEPSDSIGIRAISLGAKDKYVTLYKKALNLGEKDIYITGWRGEYELCGRPEYINFLYYCGLGARNSDGFGMFESIDPTC